MYHQGAFAPAVHARQTYDYAPLDHPSYVAQLMRLPHQQILNKRRVIQANIGKTLTLNATPDKYVECVTFNMFETKQTRACQTK